MTFLEVLPIAVERAEVDSGVLLAGCAVVFLSVNRAGSIIYRRAEGIKRAGWVGSRANF